jgi:hypothetical protein
MGRRKWTPNRTSTIETAGERDTALPFFGFGRRE